jgi:histone H3/H4
MFFGPRSVNTAGQHLTMAHHRNKNYDNYDLYVHRVLKQVCPDCPGISKKAMEVICSMVCDLERKLSVSAGELTWMSHSQTLTAREIQTAVKLNLPGELAKHAVSEGTKAVTKEAANPHAAGTKHEARQDRAGIVFPVGRIERHLRTRRYAKRVGTYASTYLAAVLEYIVAELLEVASKECREAGRNRIVPRCILLGIRNDEELNRMFHNAAIPNAGVLPNIHAVLMQKE